MKYGSIAGLQEPVSRLIMGTMIYSPDDMPLTCAMLDSFVSLGGNTLDTAHVYGQGDAERAVGEWMRLRGNRAEIVIIGKGAHHDAQGPRVNPAAIASDLEESLALLGTDYIDLYLLHRDDPTVPVGEIVTCLNEHYQAGRMRAFGGSNWSHQRLGEALDYAGAHGLVPFVASSSNFSLAVMNEPPWPGAISVTREGKDWYREHQFPLLAWSSQAQGFFTGAPLRRTTLMQRWYASGTTPETLSGWHEPVRWGNRRGYQPIRSPWPMCSASPSRSSRSLGHERKRRPVPLPRPWRSHSHQRSCDG